MRVTLFGNRHHQVYEEVILEWGAGKLGVPAATRNWERGTKPTAGLPAPWCGTSASGLLWERFLVFEVAQLVRLCHPGDTSALLRS